MKTANRAALELSLSWESEFSTHRDRYYAGKVDFWRDIFPGDMERHVVGLNEGEKYKASFSKGELVPPFEPNKVIEFKETQFDRHINSDSITPALGRFYPQGLAWTALHCYRGDLNSFRLIKLDGDILVADTNHPLAHYPLVLEAHCKEKFEPIEEHGGVCNDIAEMVTKSGPGMQVAYPGVVTDFYSSYPLPRKDEAGDAVFYKEPRFVMHLDRTAIGQVESIYGELLSSGAKILDLMSSWVSHLPSTLRGQEVIGLGLNEAELRSNKQLSGFVVHDLNENPELPFDNNEFDAVICTVSIEYLIQPIEVITEVARITKPGGVFISAFSNRWFPGKETLVWSQLHPFERQALILDYYYKTQAFDNLHTESIRGLPRPRDDKYINETEISDPIFAVWGRVKG